MIRNTVLAAAAAALVCFSAPAGAQQGNFLPPDVTQALTQMSQIAGQFCQMGNQQACMEMQTLQQAYPYLNTIAQQCQGGDPNACQQWQMEYGQLGMAYQRYMTIAQGGAGAGGGGQAMNHNDFQDMMQQQHNQTMQRSRDAAAQRSLDMQRFRDRMGLN